MHPIKKQRALLLQESQIDESPSSSVDGEYIAHLKSQCAIRYTALKTAESLIAAYQKENETLKHQNSLLRERIQTAQDTIEHGRSEEVEILEKILLKYTQRISQLLERDIQKDRRMAELEKELDLMHEKQGKIRVGQDSQGRREERWRQGQQKFNNFLKLPPQQSSFSSIGSRYSFQKTSLQVLEGEVKKKDAQILSLLKRLRDVEEELRMRVKRERLKTSDTHNSMRKNTYSSFEE